MGEWGGGGLMEDGRVKGWERGGVDGGLGVDGENGG